MIATRLPDLDEKISLGCLVCGDRFKTRDLGGTRCPRCEKLGAAAWKLRNAIIRKEQNS